MEQGPSNDIMKSPYAVAIAVFVVVLLGYMYYEKNYKKTDSKTASDEALKVSCLAAVSAFLVLYLRRSTTEPILTDDFLQ